MCALLLWGFVGLFGLCWVLCGLVCVLFVFVPLALSVWLWLVTHVTCWPQGVPRLEPGTQFICIAGATELLSTYALELTGTGFIPVTYGHCAMAVRIRGENLECPRICKPDSSVMRLNHICGSGKLCHMTTKWPSYGSAKSEIRHANTHLVYQLCQDMLLCMTHKLSLSRAATFNIVKTLLKIARNSSLLGIPS